MVSVHMIFIPEISEAKVQYLFLFLSYKIFQLLFSIECNLDWKVLLLAFNVQQFLSEMLQMYISVQGILCYEN